jgi:integrase
VILATWDEIDMEERVWTRPAGHMKAGLEHRVPLSDRAIEILKTLPREEGNPHVFVGGVKGKGLSNMAMLALLKGTHAHLTVHGFRSSARDWAGESTAFPHDICEMALAHARENKVHGAYQRGELLTKRRKLMDAWAAYCAKPAASGSNVREFKRA